MLVCNRSVALWLKERNAGMFIEHAGVRSERIGEVAALLRENLALEAKPKFDNLEEYVQLMQQAAEAECELPLRAIIGRQQDKVGTEIKGYHFVINVEKSRYVKEKSKIPISVSWDGGVQSHSGLLDVALSGNYVAKPSNGWYCRVDRSTGELVDPKFREKDTLTEEFWKPIFENTDFKEYVKSKYQIGLIPMDDVELDIEEA